MKPNILLFKYISVSLICFFGIAFLTMSYAVVCRLVCRASTSPNNFSVKYVKYGLLWATTSILYTVFANYNHFGNVSFKYSILHHFLYFEEWYAIPPTLLSGVIFAISGQGRLAVTLGPVLIFFFLQASYILDISLVGISLFLSYLL